jgi:hypothetical protein
MLIASERAVRKDRLKGYCVEHDPAKRRRIRSGLEPGASVRPVARAVLDLLRQERGEAGRGLRSAKAKVSLEPRAQTQPVVPAGQEARGEAA